MKIQSKNARQFVQHIENLAALAEVEYWDAEKLYYRLCRLEAKAHKLSEYECNTGEDMDSELNRILLKVKRMFPGVQGLFINGDPRGFSLKIKENEAKKLRENGINIYSDWGGYGILAPEF